MADVRYGGSSGDWSDEIRRIQDQGRAREEMRRKEEARQETEERGRGVDERSASQRRTLSDETSTLTTRITSNTEAIRGETAALEANIAIMQRAVALRREMAGLPLVSPSSGAAASRAAAAGTATGTATGAAAQDAELARIQARNAADQRARAEANLAAARVAEQRVAATTFPQLPPGRPFAELPPASYIEAGPVGSTGRGHFGPVPFVPPGPRPTGSSGEEAAREAQRIESVGQKARESTSVLEGMGAAQRSVNQDMAQANAIFAEYSTRLSRHGALTTEFIQALARGQVTLQEFGSQMVSVIGKFGGWLAAGAAVYGIVGVFKDLTEGATESQAAIQQLGRFLPGLGGPAGGGSGGVSAAYGMVRGLSTQFNVPIKEVTDSAQVMARLFGSGPNPLGNTQQATSAVLAASRLDQVDPTTAQQYLTGIAQSEGFLGRPDAGRQMVGVINSLNALQNRLGARVAQTLPAIARAAPAAYAAGLDPAQLGALAAVGVRAGIPGAQVGTALLRSMSTFAFRGSSREMLREYGLNPQLGQYGNLVTSLFTMIDRRARGEGGGGPRGTGPLSGVDLRNLALAVGGPLLGARTLLPMLAAEQRYPGLYNQALGIYKNPPSYQRDLDAVLGTVGERFKSIGITLQNFGGQLAQSGLLTPVTGLLNTFNTLAHVAEALATPFADLLGVVNQLPGPVRDALGVFLAFRAARYISDTRFGSAAQTMIGRVPGLQFLRNEPREAVMGIRSNLEREILPQEERDAEIAAGRLRGARGAAVRAQGDRMQFEAANAAAANAPPSSERRQQYEEELAGLQDREARAIERADIAETEFAALAEQAARTQALINIAKDKQLTAAQKAGIMEEAGWAGTGQTTNLASEYTARYRAQALGGRPPEESMAAAAAVTTAAAVNSFANNGALQGTLLRGMAQQAPGGPERAMPVMPFGAGRMTIIPGAARLDTAADRFSQVAERMQRAVPSALGVSSFGMPLGGAGVSPMMPIAALLGTQMLGSAFGGGIGSYISNVGGQAAAGAMIAQMLGRSTAGGAAIGTVAGAFQQGTGAGIGSLLGGGAGAAIGMAIGSGGGPIGALIGSQVGSLIGNLISPQQSPEDQQQQGNREAIRRLARAGLLPRGTGDLAAMASGNADFSTALPMRTGLGGQADQAMTDLVTSFLGSGASAQQAQARLGPQVQGLQAIQELYGTQSRQGRAAAVTTQTLIQAALGESAVDPAAAAQLVQQLTQGRQKVLQEAFTSAMSGQVGYGAGLGAAGQFASQYQAVTVGPQYQNFLDEQESLRQAQQYAAQRPRDPRARAALQAAQDSYDAARGAYTIAQRQATPVEQSAFMQQLQQAQQQQSAATAYRQAAAGGNVMGQIAAQQGGLQNYLAYLNQLGPGRLGAANYAQQYNQTQAQRLQLQTQAAQQGLTELQGRGTLAVSQVPLGHPVREALVQAQQYRDQVRYMQQHAKDFDPAQIAQAQAQANDAWKQVAQQFQDYNTQMNDLKTQAQVARDTGDAVAQAVDQLHGAMRDLKFARTPAARAQAQANVAQYQAQVQQAQFERIGSQGQLAAAQLWYDPSAAATALMSAAERQMAFAHGIDQQVTAQQNFAQAQQAQHQAAMQLIQVQGQYQQALAAGDNVTMARAAVTTAERTLAAARGTFEQTQAEAGLVQAQYALQQAYAQRQVALGQLSASETVDPVQALQRQLRGLQNALPYTKGRDARIALRTQINQTTHQAEQALIDQRESTTDFQFQMMQITSQQAIQQLQSLLRLRGITRAQRQQILEQIRRYSLGMESPLGASGQFDLAPGNIRLPTFYDVARGLRGGRPGGASAMAINNATQINVYVRHAGDVPKVADAIDRATSSHVRARLRSAGVTG